MHKTINSKIFYFGTPVVLISTLNENGTPNLAPMSSAWWLNHSCMLGMSGNSQTVTNLIRERECVLNLPSAALVSAVDKLALTTGKKRIPDYKLNMGYEYVADKFGRSNLTAKPAQLVKAPVVHECPVQLEAIVKNIHSFDEPSFLKAIEVEIIKTHIDESILVEDNNNYIDPEKWKPLIMNFCEFFSLGDKLHHSRLAKPFISQCDNN
ncbi:flavin reductase family protein [Halalkalibacterium halodurans]|uniref:flavin reductase family protein n=1 Tax=Halalkalibacterium halodurans TaxID=86665 RepID=UPI002AA9BFE4|nr:flavin reductase family protein [Halalkalibacterium halodurans]MDY7224496.1 flavin reductase family protein [Halalkalibacterium halodurans]MDY7243781.1 flavin reductase family protein [Halalkalibacterium halodurans]